MLMFTLVISCLTTSNLPWFMDLTFQVPMQYCSLQHQILLLSSVTSATGCCFCFGSISSFSLQLFLHSCPVAYWAPTDLQSSSFSVISSSGETDWGRNWVLFWWLTLLVDLRPNYGGGNEDNGDLLQKVPCTHCTPRPRPCTRPLLTHISAGGSWTLTGKSGSVWWWTGKPGVLQSMGSQGVRHDWVTELKWPFPLSLITLFTSHLPSAAAVFLLCPSWYFSSIL